MKLEPELSIDVIKDFDKGVRKFRIGFWPTVLIMREEFEKRGFKVVINGEGPWIVEIL